MAKNKGGRPGKQYRKYPGPQKGNPMWRDPAQAQPSGCPLTLLALLAVPVGLVVGVVHIVT